MSGVAGVFRFCSIAGVFTVRPLCVRTTSIRYATCLDGFLYIYTMNAYCVRSYAEVLKS